MGNARMPDDRKAAALAAIDWTRVDAMTDQDIADQIAANPDAAPDLADAPPEAVRPVHPAAGVNVRGIRAKTGLTQAAFAARYGFAVGTLRDWEQGRKQPEPATRTLLLVIERDPDLVATIVARYAA